MCLVFPAGIAEGLCSEYKELKGLETCADFWRVRESAEAADSSLNKKWHPAEWVPLHIHVMS